ncbi:hypothetical protein A0U98_06900 [Shigella boydii]|nr:hypothetical protein A0U98_06900 [Shigella boydii]
MSRNPETISLRYEHQKVGREIYGPRYFIRTMRYFLFLQKFNKYYNKRYVLGNINKYLIKIMLGIDVYLIK